MPLLENFDLRILNERPYRIGTGQDLWIQDLEVTHSGGRQLDPEQVGLRFEEAFFAAWNGLAESDGFNRLVLAAGLGWRQAMIISRPLPLPAADGIALQPALHGVRARKAARDRREARMDVRSEIRPRPHRIQRAHPSSARSVVNSTRHSSRSPARTTIASCAPSAPSLRQPCVPITTRWTTRAGPRATCP